MVLEENYLECDRVIHPARLITLDQGRIHNRVPDAHARILKQRWVRMRRPPEILGSLHVFCFTIRVLEGSNASENAPGC